MKQTRLLMGMPITLEIVDAKAGEKDLDLIFNYFKYVDLTFSTYKKDSEISKINANKLKKNKYSHDMNHILMLAEKTKVQTDGFFNIEQEGKLDPSGIVKGWAILEATKKLKNYGFKNFYVDAGGDIQVSGKNHENKHWTVGIRNPFNSDQIVKVLKLNNQGVATSGTAARGQHIYNPHLKNQGITDILSITVIAKDVLEADRFATAAFAMGKVGINFLEKMPYVEGYMIDIEGVATMTSGFSKFTV